MDTENHMVSHDQDDWHTETIVALPETGTETLRGIDRTLAVELFIDWMSESSGTSESWAEHILGCALCDCSAEMIGKVVMAMVDELGDSDFVVKTYTEGRRS